MPPKLEECFYSANKVFSALIWLKYGVFLLILKFQPISEMFCIFRVSSPAISYKENTSMDSPFDSTPTPAIAPIDSPPAPTLLHSTPSPAVTSPPDQPDVLQPLVKIEVEEVEEVEEEEIEEEKYVMKILIRYFFHSSHLQIN